MDLTEASSVVVSLNAALNAALPALNARVRQELEPDLDFCATLYALTRDAEMATVDWSEATKSAFCRSQFDAQRAHYRAHYPNANFLVIERDYAPIGRLYFEQSASELRLMEITLLTAARNLGIGGALSGALLSRAADAGVVMGLHVEPYNPARRLYERQGFKTIEERGPYLYMVCEPTRPAIDLA